MEDRVRGYTFAFLFVVSWGFPHWVNWIGRPPASKLGKVLPVKQWIFLPWPYMHVIFVLSQFVLASVLLTPVFVREINAWWEGQGMTCYLFGALMVKFYNQFWFASTCMVQLQLNNLTSKRISALLSILAAFNSKVHIASLWLPRLKYIQCHILT